MIDVVKVSLLAGLLAGGGASALAQDVRGIEICTVEKQIDRRTSCLQSNVEFLQSTLTKQTRENAEKFMAAGKEIAALKEVLTKLRSELDELKKAKPAAGTPAAATPAVTTEPKR